MAYVRHNGEMTDMDTLQWTLGERLAKARRRRRWSQQEMADRLGIGRRSIVRYEDDQAIPSLAVVIAWAQVTSVPLSWLLDEPTDSAPVDQGYLHPSLVTYCAAA